MNRWWRGLFGLALVALLGCSERDPAEAAQALMVEGRSAEARALLREALDRDPEQPGLQLLYGRVLATTGDLYLAEWPLRKAAEHPDYAVAARRVLAPLMNIDHRLSRDDRSGSA